MQEQTTTEQWVEIEGYPHYMISDHGRVMHLRRRGGVYGYILSPWRNHGGYLMVDLFDGQGNRRRASVHSLVSEAYHGGRPEGHQVNHLDGDPARNDAKNLAWATRKENMQHAAMTGLLKYAKLTYDDACDIVLLRGHESSRSIAARYGVRDRTVRQIWQGVRWPQALLAAS